MSESLPSSGTTIIKGSVADGVTAALPAAQQLPSEPKSSTSCSVLPKTEPIWMADTNLFELRDCDLLEAVVKTGEQPKGMPDGFVTISVVLSRTIFHPQGGGQQADTGRLTCKDLPELAVAFASLRREDGAVLHDGAADPKDAARWVEAVGKVQVMCHIDRAKRQLAARLHSAGHLLDAAVTAVGLNWVPAKGYHFPDGPYVEYILNEKSRKIDPKKAGDKESVIQAIQSNIDRLVSAGGSVTVRQVDGVRNILMAGEECPCGGTHVPELVHVGPIEVKKLQNKQGNVRLSYNVAPTL